MTREVIEDTGAATELTPAGRTVRWDEDTLKRTAQILRKAERGRVYVLAASADQADLFARRWVSEGDGRARADVVYMNRYVRGWFLRPQDRIVALEGYWRNRDSDHIERCVRRTLAKTGHDWSVVESEPV